MNFNKDSYSFIFFGLLFSFIFSSTGLAMIFLLANFTTFNCQRIDSNRGSCQLKTVTGPFNKEQIRTFPLQELKSAYLQSFTSSSKTTLNVALKTETEDIRIPTDAYGATGTTASLVTEINNFINNPKETSLKVQQDDRRWEIYFLAGLFLLIPNYIAINLIKLGIHELRNE